MKARLTKLFTLLTILTLGITNVWGALTAHTPGVYEKTTDKGGYGCTLTTVASGANAGTFEVYYFSANSKYGNTTDVYGGGSKQQYRLMCADDDSEYQLINTSSTSAFTNSCDWIEMAYATTGFSKSDYTYSSAFNEFFAIAPNGGNTSNTKTCYIKPKNGDILTLKVSGYVEFAILGADNGSSKYMTITVDGGTPTSWKSNTLSRRSVELTTGEHTIVVANVGNSANNFYGFSLKLPAATKHTVTYDLNGGTGTTPTQADVAEGAKFTLHDGVTDITAPANKDFDGWHDGTTKYAGGAEYTMGTSNVTLTAQWKNHVANYTVIYKDGTTELGSETVEVGQHPTGSGITAPTKDCYTFAGWDPALSGVSGSDGDEIVVNATWTPLYASSFNFGTTTDLTKDNIATKLATSNIFCSVGTGGSYDAGGTTGYLGYKFKNNGDYVTFIVQDGYEAIVTYGYTESGWQVNGADAGVTVKTQAYVDKKYQAEGSDLLLKLVNQSANSKTSVLTNIVIKATATGEDDATLSDLSVSGYTLNPSFDSATEDYTITKEYGAADPVVGDVTATPSVTGADADIAWDGTNHKFVITVTAKDGVTEKTYNITINEAEARKSLSRVLFSNGFDAFIDNTNHTVKAFYLAGTAAPTTTTITAGAGTAGTLSEGKIRVTGADDSYVDYIVTLAEVTPNTTTVAEDAAAGEFAGDEAWVKNGLLIYGNAAGYSAGDKWYVNRRLTKSGDAADDQRVIAGWVRSYFFVGNAKKFIMTVGGNKNLDYTIDGGTPVENVNVETLEIALTKGNHMIEIVSHQQSGDCRLSAPKLVEFPASHTVTYMPGDGTGTWVVDDDAIEVADCPNTFTAPEGKIFDGWKDESDNDVEVGAAVTTDMALTAQWINHYAVTFNMNGHGDAPAAQDIKHGEKATKPADPIAVGFDFGGWFTDAACTAGNEFDFNTAITGAKELFAKWTEFDGCVLLVPATSGPTIALGDEIDMQTGSFGATMVAIAKSGETSSTLAYDSYGLSFASSGNTSRVTVTLNHELAVGSKITLVLVANGTSGSNRALDLYKNTTKVTSIGWTSSDTYAKFDEGTFTYTVTNEDGLAGMNEFSLYRNNSVFLKRLTVEACGAAITYHNLTSEVNIAGKGTVTLGASSVREGYTTTATYSEIDPLYEFVNWTVSGAGASIADASANPATITMGTEDAVITLNLRLIPVKFTVEYYDGATLMGSEQVAVNENPTASEIVTAKRHYTFLGWSETDGGNVVALNTITRTEAGTVKLYAKYEAVVCPTSGTVYKFQLKTDLTNGNVFDSKPNSVAFTTDNYLSELTGGTLTGAIDNNNVNRLQFYDNKAVGFASGSGGSLTIALDCALAEGDVIKYINYASSGNKMTLSDGTHTQTLDGNGKEEIQTWDVPAAWAGAMDLTLTRGGNTPKLTYFEIYRHPVATGVTLSDLTVRVGAKKTPEMTLAPSADARVNSQAWTITSGDTYITIDAATGEITGVAEGDATVKVVLNDDPSISATATVHVVGSIAQQDVTKSTIWDWHNTGATANIQLTNTSDPQKNEQFVLANVDVDNDEDFESDKLVVEGEHMVRDYDKTNPYFQGQLIKFNSTVAGIIRVKFSHTGKDKPARELFVNGVGTGDTRTQATGEWSRYVEVPAGEVAITAYHVDPADGAGQQYIRVFEIEFYALGHSRDVTPGNLGTLCLPNACIARGVDVYALAGKEATYGKIVFEDLESDDLLVAGQAYIFQVNEATAKFYYAPGESVAAPLNNTALKGNLGSTITFQPNSPEAENVYFVKDHALWSAKETGVNIGQYRAYLQMDEVTAVTSSSPAPGRRYIMLGTNGQNQAQGIDDVQDDVRSTKMLIDGRLFILRGEKIYDATGRLVK